MRNASAAARAHLAAGEWTRARTIATDLLAEAGAGPLRAEASSSSPSSSTTTLPFRYSRKPCASSHAALQALIHIRLAWAERFRKGFAAALDYPAEP